MNRTILLLLSLLLPIADVMLAVRTARADLAPAMRDIRTELRASAAPILLPQPLPPVFGTIRSIAVISAGRAGYYVGFSTVPHCGGALSCAFFHVAGYRQTPALEDSAATGLTVRLPDGTRATFRPADCSGAGCTEASLSFRRGTTEYELDAKVRANALSALESAYRNLRPLW